MEYHQFLKEVQEKAMLESRDEALRATRATLETLGERLMGGEKDDLASQLPRELQESLQHVSEASKKMNLEEFIQTVGEKEGISIGRPRDHIQAVIQVLREAVSPGEFQDVMAQLPDEYRDLFTSR